jgi:hypothetical protein
VNERALAATEKMLEKPMHFMGFRKKKKEEREGGQNGL